MHGSPILRALLLTASLAVVGLIINAIAGQKSAAPITPAETPEATDQINALLTIHLSAPANSLTLTSLDGNTTYLSLNNPALDSEHSLQLPLLDQTSSASLSITWTEPGNQCFARLVLEPDFLATRELVLHAPENLEDHTLEFEWDPE